MGKFLNRLIMFLGLALFSSISLSANPPPSYDGSSSPEECCSKFSNADQSFDHYSHNLCYVKVKSSGHVGVGGVCNATCPDDHPFLFNGSCQCSGTALDKDGVCIPYDDCPAGWTRVLSTQSCVLQCSEGMERVGDSCLPKCDGNQTRQPNGSCGCSSEQELVYGYCLNKCKIGQSRNASLECVCPSGQVLSGEKCVDSCPSPRSLDSYGNCLCPAGQGWSGSSCITISCPDGSSPLADGSCPSKPENCPDGTPKPPSGVCEPPACGFCTIPDGNGGCMVDFQNPACNAGDGNPPPGDGNPPPGDGNPPPGDGNPPPGDGNPPPGDGNPPPGDGNPPPGDGNPPPGDGNPPPGDGNPPPGDGNPPPGDEEPDPGSPPTPGPGGHGFGSPPAVPAPKSFFTSEYPDGLLGVWRSFQSQLLSNPLLTSLNSLGSCIPSGGSCPDWQIPVNLGYVNFGTFSVSPPCWLWGVIKAILILSTIFAARRIVFGG